MLTISSFGSIWLVAPWINHTRPPDWVDAFPMIMVIQEVRGKTPTVFKLRGFGPGKRVRVAVSVGEFGQEREARFTTTSDKTQWKIAT